MTTHPDPLPVAPRGCGASGGCGRSESSQPCHCCDVPETCDLECLERPLFTAGMVLSDTDLTALVDWTDARVGLHRHRGGWGVVCGLDVHCDPDRPGSVVVEPGYAVDCCGHDIVLCEAESVDLTGCCAVRSPCDEPAREPGNTRDPDHTRGPDTSASPLPPPRDPCGDVVVDVVLSQLVSPAVPELAEACSCGCDRGCDSDSRIVPTRLREGALVEPVRVPFPRSDPMRDAAERAQAAYHACHDIVRHWVEAGEKADASRDDVVAWLRERVVDPPCDWWDRTCAELDGADGPTQVEEVMVRALLDLVIACRHRLLRRPCGRCDTDRVGLARVWLRRVEDTHGTTCVVTRVDAYRPHRRELGPDTRPVPSGAEDLGDFVWQRWEQICSQWRRLARTTPRTVLDVPSTTDDLLQVLDATDRLWWACGDPAPQPIVVEDQCLGTRVIGFLHHRKADDEGGLEDLRGIGKTYARRLQDAGTSTIDEITMLEPGEIAVVLGCSDPVAEAIWLDAVQWVRGTR